MALSGAEKAKRFRERQKAKEQAALKQPEVGPASYLRQPFDEWLGDRWNDSVIGDFDLAGFDPGVTFPGKDNADPHYDPSLDDGPNRGAIGCAERIVGVFLDAAVELAGRINTFKKQEIKARIAELEAADLTDPAKRKQAMADIVRLTKYRDQLEKQVRWTLPQWKVKGE